jgi:hypothetical protein
VPPWPAGNGSGGSGVAFPRLKFAWMDGELPVGKLRRGMQQQREGLNPASKGAGPLLQRDYWAVLCDCPLSPPEVARVVRERFADFPPEQFVVFRRVGDAAGPLEVGDELEVEIRMSGTAGVRVVHVDANSITLGTAVGHPEAGRITFGAYRNDRGDVLFHIRSRARSSSSTRYAGFLTAGEPMQTNTWTDFIDRLAHNVAEGVIGAIEVETHEIADEDDDALDTPTFIARGD